MKALKLGWLGVRCGNATEMSKFCRDVLGLNPLEAEDGSSRFRLADGTEVHVYGEEDSWHEFFGTAPVVGFEVDSFDGARRAFEAFKVPTIYPDPQREGGRAWQHFRAPDGNVYEVIGPDDLGAEAPIDPETGFPLDRLPGMSFRLLRNADGGGAGTDTVLTFASEGPVLEARYRGGDIAAGHAFAKRVGESSLEMACHAATRAGEVRAEFARGRVFRMGTAVRMRLHWRWLTGDRASGISDWEFIGNDSKEAA